MNIVCFPGAAYDFPLPTNRQQMMRRLALRGHRVLYVEPPRFPFSSIVRPKFTLPDFAAWVDRYKGVSERMRVDQGGLYLHTQLNPYPGADGGVVGPTVESLNRRLTSRTVERSRFIHDPHGFVLWIYTPAALWAARVLRPALVVYDCVDDYAAQPGFRAEPNAEQALAARADVVFASTQGLTERLRKINPNTHCLPNVADYDHFATSVTSTLPIPSELAELPRPILGYVGALDRYKFDSKLVLEVALAYPSGSIVLVGPTGVVERVAGAGDVAMQRLRQLPNVHLLGPRPHVVLPAYLQCFDVALIPYQRNKYTAECSPLKLHEYLAAGLPVAAAGLPAIRRFSNVVAYSDDGSDFLVQVERALAEGRSRSAERQAIARGYTWDAKVDGALRLIMQALEAR